MKHTKRQILESIRYWKGVLGRMDESLDGMSVQRAGELGRMKGREIAEYLTPELMRWCLDLIRRGGGDGAPDSYGEDTQYGDDYYMKIVETVPEQARNGVFDVFGDEDLAEMARASTNGRDGMPLVSGRGFNRANLVGFVLPAMIQNGMNVCKRGGTFESTASDYANEDFGYYSEDGGAVDKFMAFCFDFCGSYGEAFATMLNDAANASGRAGMAEYRIGVRWLVPTIRTETVRASSRDEAVRIVRKKYEGMVNRHSPEQEVFDGIDDEETVQQ